MAHLLALGYGFSARTLAPLVQARGWHVTGTSRTPRVEDGVTLLSIADAIAAAETVTHIVVSIPPGEGGDPVLANHLAQLRTLPNLKWIGYLSTVGVYGDYGGDWIDETAPLKPQNPRSIWRAQAERAWLALAASRGIAGQVFRLAGIYGPGRNPLKRVKAGRAQRIIKPGQVFNRIHVADIAHVVLAGIDHPTAGPIFNVADGQPAPPQDVVAYAAELLGLPPLPDIPFDQAEMTPMARSFYADNKRVDVSLLRTALGVELHYPTYQSGLQSLLQDEG